MATTFIEAKICVNCIAPGIFPSEMTAGSSGEDQKSTLDMKTSNPAGDSLLGHSIPFDGKSEPNTIKGRTGNDSDMAACILFLAKPGGLFLNAQVIYPDGGKSPLCQPNSKAYTIQAIFWYNQLRRRISTSETLFFWCIVAMSSVSVSCTYPWHSIASHNWFYSSDRLPMWNLSITSTSFLCLQSMTWSIVCINCSIGFPPSLPYMYNRWSIRSLTGSASPPRSVH